DEHSFVLFAEIRQNCARAVDGAKEIYVNNSSEYFGRQVLKSSGGADSGVIDPDIDLAKATHGFRRNVLYCCFIGHVGNNIKGFTAEFLTLCNDIVESMLPPGCNHD